MCIPDHHPGYISFEQYVANQARLRANWSPPRGEGGGAAREGRALLQGLMRCGRCGRRMQVGYSGRTLTPRYRCIARPPAVRRRSAASRVGGRRIERAVLDAVFEALRPAAIDATLRAIEHAQRQPPGERALGRARARARPPTTPTARAASSIGCEPENRLVARTLEREWEQRLAACRARRACARRRRAPAGPSR